jgi:bifunctional DNase/RNase
VEKVRLDILDISPSQVQAGSFTMILSEESGDMRLPIIIGMFEAQAIMIELEKIKSTRPLTHDLFVSFGKAFDFTVEEVLISNIADGVFYAKIVSSDGVRQKNIDARPSDAIAIALRFKAPIYTTPKVLDEAGVSTSELMGESENGDENTRQVSVEVRDSKQDTSSLSDLSILQLQNLLQKSLENEEYEEAAKIRDEIERRN